MGIEPNQHPTENSTNPAAGGARGGAQNAKTPTIDAALAAVIDAWPALPEAIRAGILAMVRAASGWPASSR
jgi:hypothetical protein